MGKILRIPSDLRARLRSHGLDATDLVLYINSACNLRCRHCYVGDDILGAAYRYHAVDLNDFVNSFETLDRVTVLGGEPLLHREINSIVENISAKQVPSFRITTNLTGLGAFNHQLHRSRRLTLCVSVDGHDESIHDVIRGNGNFERTIGNLKLLLRAGYDVEITHTIMSTNIASFDRMVALCRNLGVQRLNLHCMSLHGNALNNPELRVQPAQWVGFRERLASKHNDLSALRSGGISIRYPVLFVTQDDYDRLVASGEYHHHASGSYYGRGARVILYADGKIHISSEAFGTDAFIGQIKDGEFHYNPATVNELVVFRTGIARIDQMNPRQRGDDIYPRVLSVSFKKEVLI